MNEQSGRFTITLSGQKKVQREIQHALEQLVDVSRLADRETLNAMLYDLFTKGQQDIADKKAGQEFLVTLLGAVHHYLSTINIFV